MPVILCGGSGSRLWPLSRTDFPKQFLSLTGSKSFFQKTVARFTEIDAKEFHANPPLIVTAEEYQYIAIEQLNEIGISKSKFILEPHGRNTAPALTLAALSAIEDGIDPVMVVLPADQNILDLESFRSIIRLAVKDAAQSIVVTLGVVANRAETGYGYIQCDNTHEKDLSKVVMRFVEKPDLKTAEDYIGRGDFYWNSGIFILKASVWLKAVELFQPDIFRLTKLAWDSRIATQKFGNNVINIGCEQFSRIPSVSIDCAVMERCPGSPIAIKMYPLIAGWSDVGAWDAVWELLEKDDNGNAFVGDVIGNESYNTLVCAKNRLVTVLGVKDLVVVETADAVLVTHNSHSQGVKRIVDLLRMNERAERIANRKVHRPWGWYDSIDQGPRFKVKRIQVNPGASLSLQRHEHRAEHWVVVKGVAEVSNGNKKVLLKENESTYIPVGETHRLANPGSEPLEIIEIQSGEYLGEDDITRLEDTYGRSYTSK